MIEDKLADLIAALEAEAEDAAYCVRAEYPAAGESIELSELDAELVGERHLIGHVRAGTVPAGLNLVQSLHWQLGDQQRMRQELDAQRAAFFERLAGVTLH